MRLRLRVGAQERELVSDAGEVVGRLAKAFVLPEGGIEWVRVSAFVHRSTEQIDDAKYKAMCKVDEWEAVLCTLCLAPGAETERRRPAKVSTAS